MDDLTVAVDDVLEDAELVRLALVVLSGKAVGVGLGLALVVEMRPGSVTDGTP